jgi:hypothetical protein
VKIVHVSAKPFALQTLPNKSEAVLQAAVTKQGNKASNLFTISAFCCLFE